MTKDIKKEIQKKLGNEIYQARDEKGWSRKDLMIKVNLKDVDIGEDSLKKYENGARNMKPSTLFILAVFLELDLNKIRDDIKSEINKNRD